MSQHATLRLELIAGPLSAEPLSTEQLDAVTALATAAQQADGAPPFSEQTLVALRRPGSVALAAAWQPPGIVTESSTAEGTRTPGGGAEQLVGAGVVVLGDNTPGEETPDVLELAVHPDHRGQQIAIQLAQLLESSLSSSSDRAAGARAWAHGEHPAAPRLAQRFGWSPVRELWRMRLENSVDAPQLTLPDGVRLRSFVAGEDDAAWLAVNAAAFADHPEQGQLTQQDLQARIDSDWFNPEGFLLAEEDGELLGFHWTKIAPNQPGEVLGEVYVVGVAPQAQGRGLGASLTAAGINYLRGQNVDAIILYVDASNTAAAQLYKKLGFTVWDVDTQYAPGAEASAEIS